MTNQEAIEIIKEHIAIHKYKEPHAILIFFASQNLQLVEALEMAISALAEKPISITWSDNTAKKTKLYCRKSGYLCEFATEYGYCQITACVKEPFLPKNGCVKALVDEFGKENR